MKTITKIVLSIIVVILGVVVIVIAGMYKFNYLASQDGYDVDGNKLEVVEDVVEPKKDFEIIEVLGESCESDIDCDTPSVYATQSRCPYDSVCIDNSCTVICPHPFTGVRSEFVEVDFEGEADPNIMTLDMHTWKWIRTSYNNDTELVPNSAGVFSLTFKDDGTVSVGTDCNSMNGPYVLDGKNITFGPMMSTRMYCEKSQEQEFSKMLAEAQSYFFTSKGELIFDLKFDSGSSVFR